MKISAVIFDMDGVIFDTERISRQVWKLAEKEFNVKLDDEFFVEIMGVNHHHVFDIYTKFLGDYEFGKKVFEWRQGHIKKIIDTEGVAVKKGFSEIISYLNRENIHQAIATASYPDRVAYLFEKSGIKNPFTVIVTGDMIQHSKPDPEIYLHAAAELGIPIAECMIIEDSVNGIKGGIASGAMTVMVPDMVSPTEEIVREAFSIENSLLDVVDLIESNNHGDAHL
ncbi:MAG: HAD family phosphatase [Chloroflexi bacterium]|nr:HAD family phosphatase [Chloroflexota bacterium]